MRKSPGIAERLKEWAKMGKSSRNQYASVSTSDIGNSPTAVERVQSKQTVQTLASHITCTLQTSMILGTD